MHFVVTLAERDFLKGAAVLYNSLVRNSFDGVYVIGFRDRPLVSRSSFDSLANVGNQVRLIELETPLHFTNFKPHFMRQVLESYPECTTITYLDPDIVLNCPFQWIGSWAEGGPAVCGDVNWWMPSNHPTRRQWILRTGCKVHHKLELYFNGGFLSVKREDLAFLDLWKELIDHWGNSDNPLDGKGEISAWRKGGRWLPFMTPDQDALNIAVMCWQDSITTLGPEVMGFAGFGELPHAVGSKKPWQRNYLLEALRGTPPRYVDKVFWTYADGPLMPFSRLTLAITKMMLNITTAISRFYRRR
jgi:hypothetical protein